MDNSTIENILPLYFEGKLGEADKLQVEIWKKSSEANQLLFEETERAWQEIDFLQTMKKYDSVQALQRVNNKIEKKGKNFLTLIQRVAAILILPLILSTLYFALKKPMSPSSNSNQMFTITSPAGMRSEYVLPDGTKVCLNSKTSLQFPSVFEDDFRNVTLKGEAYFQVAENKKKPFIVHTGEVNIEVTGTEFKASNYPDENLTEIVLVKGSINLFKGSYSNTNKRLYKLSPGERALFDESEGEIHIDDVNVDKYISWKDGILMFRDDSMGEVVKRLNRWFNVDIKLTGKELTDYVYTGTFENQSLIQILELLKISAPINYRINKREQKKDETFSKLEVEIVQK